MRERGVKEGLHDYLSILIICGGLMAGFVWLGAEVHRASDLDDLQYSLHKKGPAAETGLTRGWTGHTVVKNLLCSALLKQTLLTDLTNLGALLTKVRHPISSRQSTMV